MRATRRQAKEDAPPQSPQYGKHRNEDHSHAQGYLPLWKEGILARISLLADYIGSIENKVETKQAGCIVWKECAVSVRFFKRENYGFRYPPSFAWRVAEWLDSTVATEG